MLEIVRMVLFGRPNGFCLERAGFCAAEPLRALSVKLAAARPIPTSHCHSDAPTQSCAPTQLCCQRRIFALKSASRSYSRKTVLIQAPQSARECGSEGGQPDPRRESSDYDRSHRMKCKDSSSQAPQNDNVMRNDRGQPSEITIVSRETILNS